MRLHHHPPRSGLATVEFAVMLPFLTALLIGLWEVGRLVEIEQVLNNAAREGGRQASTGLLTNAGVQQVVLTYLQNAGFPTTHAVVTVTDLTASGTDAQNATQMDQLQVSVSIPFNDVRWLTLSLVTNPNTQLQAQATWLSVRDKAYPGASTAPPGS